MSIFPCNVNSAQFLDIYLSNFFVVKGFICDLLLKNCGRTDTMNQAMDIAAHVAKWVPMGKGILKFCCCKHFAE